MKRSISDVLIKCQFADLSQNAQMPFTLQTEKCLAFINVKNRREWNLKYKLVGWLVLFGFYGISTIIGNLKSDPLHTYILDIYDLV